MLLPIRDVLTSIDIPEDFVLIDEIEKVLNALMISDFGISNVTEGLHVSLTIELNDQARLDFLGIEGLTFVFGSPRSNTQINLFFKASEKGIYIQLYGILFSLQFPRDLFRPADSEANDDAVVAISVNGNIALDEYFNVIIDGFDRLSLPPAMIGNSGLIIAAEDLKFDLSRTETAPEIISAGFDESFVGIFIREATISYKKEGNDFAPKLTLSQGTIGSGGFGGEIVLGLEPISSQNLSSETSDESQIALDSIFSDDEQTDDPHEVIIGGHRINVYAVNLEGMRVALEYFGVTFKQSIPTSSRITGYIYLPFIEKWFKFRATIAGPNGVFMLDVGGAGDAPLISLENEWLEIKADSIVYLTKDGTHYASVSGSVRPKIDGFDWPEFQVEKLLISSEGDIELEGGWIDVPEAVTLNFHGFKIDIEQFGIGTDDEGDEPQQWLGVSGAISLIAGIPVSASVEGLKVSGPKGRLSSSPSVTLTGIGLKLEIPGTLRLEGTVSYYPPEKDEESDKSRIPDHIFKGDVTVNLIALKTEVNGKLIIGRMKNSDGKEFTAFYIVLDADLPTPIPLAATGLGIYSLGGLFGMHIAPNRHNGDDERISWYLWYKQEPEYNVTAVQKWTPEFEHYAFGAGLSLATNFDDGHTLNINALVAILIPGPVVMVEGTANLLASRQQDRQSDGAFHALAVFDGIASTFQLNIDAKYDLAKVVSISGSMEAFFHFKDSEVWHLYLGEKDPESKRIWAKILAIFSANAYLMIDNRSLLLGASSGWDFQERVGPVSVTLAARLAFDAGIFWKPLQLEGQLELLGKIGLKVFGIGFHLALETVLKGSAPTPYYVYGMLRVTLGLPWPLPDVDVKLELEWKDDEETKPEPVTPFLKQAAMIHHKLPEAGWVLLEEKTRQQLGMGIPIVPVDARPVLSFARPLQGRSGKIIPHPSGNYDDFEPLPPDVVGEWEFSYYCNRVKLVEQLGEEPTIIMVHNPADEFSERGAPFDTSEHSLLPTPDAQEPQWLLWNHSVLNGASLSSLENLPDSMPRCGIKIEPDCVDWSDIADGTVYPHGFTYKGLTFFTDFLKGQRDVIPEVINGVLFSATPISIRFPEPMALVEITIQRKTHLGTDISKFPQTEFFVFYQGNPIEVQVTDSDSKLYKRYIFQVPEKISRVNKSGIDMLQIKPPFPPGVRILKICYITLNKFNLFQNNSDVNKLQRLPTDSGAPVLKPSTKYRLIVETIIDSVYKGNKKRIDKNHEYIFITADGPGLNTQNSPGETNSNASQLLDFVDTPLNKLETYIDYTFPSHGSRHAYYNYDLIVAFNESYVESMYSNPLSIRVRDRNGKLLGAPEGAWGEGPLPLFPLGLLTMLARQEAGGCLQNSKVEGMPAPQLYRAIHRELAPKRMYTAEIVANKKENGTTLVLHSFQFATSRFPDMGKHLRSGISENDQMQIVRVLPVGSALPSNWKTKFSELYTDPKGISNLRKDLSDAIHNNQRLNLIFEKLEKVRAALKARHEYNQLTFKYLYEDEKKGVYKRFESIGLGNKTLPDVLEFIQIPINRTNNSALLIESPEPIDWQRIDIEYRGHIGNITVIWNDDQTRAFIFKNNGLWQNNQLYTLKFKFSGDKYRELPHLLQNGKPVNDDVELKIRLK